MSVFTKKDIDSILGQPHIPKQKIEQDEYILEVDIAVMDNLLINSRRLRKEIEDFQFIHDLDSFINTDATHLAATAGSISLVLGDVITKSKRIRRYGGR